MREFLNKEVTLIVTKTGAVYTGKVAGFRKHKVCLMNVIIHSKVMGMISPKNGLTRWFDMSKVDVTTS